MENLKECFVQIDFRCRSFQTTKRDEFCRIPGSTVAPTVPGNPTQIRLPSINASVFRQFILYAYTGKVSKAQYKYYNLMMVLYFEFCFGY